MRATIEACDSTATGEDASERSSFEPSSPHPPPKELFAQAKIMNSTSRVLNPPSSKSVDSENPQQQPQTSSLGESSRSSKDETSHVEGGENSLLLFDNWSSDMTVDQKLCFTLFSAVFAPIQLEGRCIPVVVVQSLWKHFLSDENNLCHVTNELVYRKAHLRYLSRSFVGKSELCLDYSHEVYVAFGDYLLERRAPEEVKVWHDTMVEILEGKLCDRDLVAGYAVTSLPEHMSKQNDSEEKILSLLSSAQFIESRIAALGILSGIERHISDCEAHLARHEKLRSIYETVSSRVLSKDKSGPSEDKKPVELIIEKARSYLCLSNSLARLLPAENNQLYYQKALEIYEDLLDYDTIQGTSIRDMVQLDMAEALHSLGNGFALELTKTNKFRPVQGGKMNRQAMQHYDRAFQIRRMLLGSHHPLLASTLHCIGVVYFSCANYPHALSCFYESLRIQKLNTEEDIYQKKRSLELGIADTLEWMGHTFYALLNYNAALDSLQEVLVKRTVYYGDVHEEIATVQLTLGNVWRDMKEGEVAVQKYQEALRIRRKLSTNNLEGMVEVLCCLGDLGGDQATRLDCYQEAMELKKDMVREKVDWIREWEEKEDDARVLPLPMYHNLLGFNDTTLSSVKIDLEWERKGKAQIQELLSIHSKLMKLTIAMHGRSSQEVSNVLYSMGEIYLYTGAYQKAISCLQDVLNIRLQLQEQPQGLHHMESVTYKLAMSYSRTGHFSKALELYTSALESSHITSGTTNGTRHIADCWYSMGVTQICTGQHVEALTSLKTCLLIRESMPSIPKLDIANTKHALAMIYTHRGNYNTARELLEEILPEFPPDTISHAHVSYYLGQVLQSTATMIHANNSHIDMQKSRHLARAQECYRKSLAIYESSYPSGAIVTAHVLHSMGNIKFQTLDYTSALPPFQRALKTYRLYNNGEHFGIAILLNSMGIAYACIDDSQRSLNCLRESLRLYDTFLPSKHSTVADTLHNIGGVHARREEFHDALRYYSRALIIREKIYGENHVLIAKTLNNMGIVYGRLDRYEDAMIRLKQALHIRKFACSTDSEDLASTLYNIGNCHARRGELNMTAHCYEEVLRMRRTFLGKDHLLVGRVLHNLGIVYQDKDDIKRAKSFYREALRVKQLNFTQGSICVANTLCKVGRINFMDKDYERALSCYTDALNMQKKLLGPNNLDVAQTLSEIGDVWSSSGKLDHAMFCFEEVIRIREERFGELNEDVAGALLKMGHVHEMLEDYEDAMIYYGNAFRIYNRLNGWGGKERNLAANSLRNVVKRSAMGSGATLACWEALVVTGDCWFSIERLLYELVNSTHRYIICPGKDMLKKNILTVAFEIDKMLELDGVITKDDANKYASAFHDSACLVVE